MLMSRRRILALTAGMVATGGLYAEIRRHTLSGNIRHHRDYRSRLLSGRRELIVYLPPDYDSAPGRRYPLLVMHDGQNLFDGATSLFPGLEWHLDESAESLIRGGRVAPVIIAGIDHAGLRRIQEYTPDPDAHGQGGGGKVHARALVTEVLPFLRRHYRCLDDPRQTGIGGSSLGALMALYTMLQYPREFGRLALMSPSVWWNDRSILRTLAKSRKLDARIWLDVGLREPRVMVEGARALRDGLIARGSRLNRTLHYLEEAGGSHSELAWARRVPAMLEYLYPGPMSAGHEG